MVVWPLSSSSEVTAPSIDGVGGHLKLGEDPSSFNRGLRSVFAGMSCDETTTTASAPPDTASCLTPLV